MPRPAIRPSLFRAKDRAPTGLSPLVRVRTDKAESDGRFRRPARLEGAISAGIADVPGAGKQGCPRKPVRALGDIAWKKGQLVGGVGKSWSWVVGPESGLDPVTWHAVSTG